ncbi:hypothetical protein GCM10017044_14600 [Kordiimonas sediminis]|uniref:PAS domain-containing protein n=1 Tax=Kordiimonas sediminis TaxID=1735581 RepID=A0A919AS36_9PROT|nr:PAS domain-containing protein [Kordiimonas sediminis]GHF20768.1 hypothetical protein GCM10017044_14600 [Kordiimonas sediminis]
MANLKQFKEFIDYWKELRHEDQLVPYHADFEPRRIASLLPRLLIVEHLPGKDEFTVRLAGTEIRERLGREITNTPYDDFFGTAKLNWRVGTETLDEILQQPAGVLGRREWLTEYSSYNCDFIYLPFKGRAGEANEFFLLSEFDKPLHVLKGGEFKQLGDVSEIYALDLGNGIPPCLQSMPTLAIS